MDKQTLTAAQGINARVDTINTLSALAYIDAEQHGLYDHYLGLSLVTARRCLAARLMEQVMELFAAAHEEEHYTEELADCIIMAASLAGYLGIDLGAAVERKRLINIDREAYHEVEGRKRAALGHIQGAGQEDQSGSGQEAHAQTCCGEHHCNGCRKGGVKGSQGSGAEVGQGNQGLERSCPCCKSAWQGH